MTSNAKWEERILVLPAYDLGQRKISIEIKRLLQVTSNDEEDAAHLCLDPRLLLHPVQQQHEELPEPGQP